MQSFCAFSVSSCILWKGRRQCSLWENYLAYLTTHTPGTDMHKKAGSTLWEGNCFAFWLAPWPGKEHAPPHSFFLSLWEILSSTHTQACLCYLFYHLPPCLPMTFLWRQGDAGISPVALRAALIKEKATGRPIRGWNNAGIPDQDSSISCHTPVDRDYL